MARMYTKTKRKLELCTKFKHRFWNIKGKNGPKTFTTIEKAKQYALKVLKLVEGKFSIIPAKKNKKFKVEKE
jgi:hypothetical protein